MYAIAVDTVPTELKRVSVVLENEIHQALLSMSGRNKRSLSNQISVILEQALIASGDLKSPIFRAEARGGRRAGAGRKSKAVEIKEPSQDSPQEDEGVEE
jgi:hypothetical protein